MIDRPYGTAGRFEKYSKVCCRTRATRSRATGCVDEKQNPTTGTRVRLGARARARRQDEPVGRVALRMSDYDFKAASRDGFGDGLADRLRGHLAVLRQGRSAARHLRHEGEHAAAARQHLQRAVKLNCGEQILKRAIAKMGRHLIPGRAGVTTDGVANKYRVRHAQAAAAAGAAATSTRRCTRRRR